MSMTTKQKQAWAKIPREIQRRILETARRLPKEQAAEFLRETLRVVAEEVKAHPRTALWTMLGYGAGEMLEHVPVIGWLTCGCAGEVLGLIGASYGLRRDRLENRLKALEQAHARAGRVGADG